MKILLDTHTFIWFVENDENLPATLRVLIENPENEIFISIVSLWEIAIKSSLGKLEMAINIGSLPSTVKSNGFTILPIFPEHTVCVASLPFHHRDPFDRMLIAQSMTEEMTIISKDSFFNDYNIDLLW